MPLRPVLYNLLKYRFGNVKIMCEGEAMVARVVKKGEYNDLDIITPGEYYAMSCPYCGDTRYRLWINHMWGFKHPDTNSRNLHLAICFNENCLKNPENLKWLYKDIYNEFDDRSDHIERGEQYTVPVDVVWPGELVGLHDLHVEHPAVLYLHGRGYDCEQLSKHYKVSVCNNVSGNYNIALGRVIIPVYREGKPYGWQARYVGNLTKEESRRIPKYWSMPGWKKSQFLYNHDTAKQFPYVVVMEGPSDVWRFGPEAIALFGKKMSSSQATMLSKWKKVALVLDGDVDENDDIQANINLLKCASRYTNVIPIRLPTDLDPGDMSQQYLRSLVFDRLMK